MSSSGPRAASPARPTIVPEFRVPGAASASERHAPGAAGAAEDTAVESTAELRPAGVPRSAVIVCHGMGQQVPFETLNAVTRGLFEAEREERGHDANPGVRVVQLSPSDLRLPRVELSLTTEAGEVREVHLYETYWAPLTEGKVRDRDVVGFMLKAGWNGLRRGLRSFERLMFDRIQQFPASPSAAVVNWLSFLGAFLVFVSLIVIQAVVVAVVAARAVLSATTDWPSNMVLDALTRDLLLVTIPAVMMLFATRIPSELRKRAKQHNFWIPWRLNRPFLALCWAFIYMALAATVVIAIMMLIHLAQAQMSSGVPAAPIAGAGRAAAISTTSGAWGDRWSGFPWYWIIIWGIAYWATHKARWFFRQYLGDVAIYVTPHTLDRFWEVRQAIKECASRVGRAVYGASDGATGPHLYDRVIVVGHSLGSVVAYDMLNELLQQDAVSGYPLQVAVRTPLFLTFGSPLDKVAYVFGTQRPVENFVEHGLEAAVQPLITGYGDDKRPARWLNISSSNDWISGDLNYFDTASPTATPEEFRHKRVANRVDPEATTPLQAHNEYWENQLLTCQLYAALTA